MTVLPLPARPESEWRRKRREAATALRIVAKICTEAAEALSSGPPSTAAAAARSAAGDLSRVAAKLRTVGGPGPPRAEPHSPSEPGRWLLTLETGNGVCAGQGMISGISWMVRGAQRDIARLQRDHPGWTFRVTWVSSTIGGNSVRTLHATNGLAVITGSSAASIDAQIKQAERGT